MTENFHRNSDIDKLNLPRKMGGRGLKSIKLAYECRIIYIRQHLLNSTHRNYYLKCVEYWWNLSIKAAIKTKNNKPDLIIWNNEVKTCQVVEFSCPADINVSKKVSEKENIYGPLIRSMQLLYPDYKFEFIPIIVGALGSIPTCLLQGIERLGFTGKQSNRIINVLQQKSIIGTVKICKTFLGFAT